MESLSTDLLLQLLEILCERYKVTSVYLKENSDREIVDDQGADLLRLIYLCVDQLVNRIELPF